MSEPSFNVSRAEVQRWLRTPAVARVPLSCLYHRVTVNRPAQFGDVVLARVKVVSGDDVIETVPTFLLDPESNENIVPYLQPTPVFATRPISAGDLILGAIGSRYALDYYHAIVPDNVNQELDLLTFGGVIGCVVSQNIRQLPPTRVHLLAYFHDQHEQIVNTRSHCPRPMVSQNLSRQADTPLTLVTGSSMEAGKTTAACCAIRALALVGCDVLAAKLTGCVTFRDPHLLGAAGAIGVTDFGAFGFPSTSGLSELDLKDLFWNVYNLLADYEKERIKRERHIVIEIADGISQPESMSLLKNSELVNVASNLIYAAPDPISAFAGTALLREWGWPRPIISGPVANSVLGIQEVQELSQNRDIEFFNSLDRDAQALRNVASLLRRRN